MISAIRIRTTVESDKLQIPELSRFMGRRVEILVVEDETAGMGASPGTSESATAPPRVLGSLRGKLHVPEDFDEPLPDELQRAFQGEG